MSNRRFPFSGSGSGERLKFYPNMKAIIAEKPSVGMDIARVVGATDKKDGYCTGNGYMVTWALGHLVSLAMPGAYGYTKTSAENLPMLPDPFRLVSRQVRTDKGMVTDIAAAKQLKIIDSVFDRCDSIIVATDCAREGELIFRWIYSYLGYTKPFKRLWISSLTDEAIREGLANLRDGSDYDSLYAAADCRAKADWLVGMNASRALAVASGSANNSIGRVQTPTLAMVCARFKENRNFVSTPYWQLHLTLKRQDAHRMFIHTEEFKEKDAAEAAYRKITSGSVATVTGSEHKRTFQQAPLLYDLTTLQKDCNVHYDLTAFGKLEEKVMGMCRPVEDLGLKKWLDNQEVCEILRISKKTLQVYRDKGILPYSRIKHKIFFKTEDVHKLLESNYYHLKREL